MVRWILLGVFVCATVPASADPPRRPDNPRSHALRNALKGFDLPKAMMDRSSLTAQADSSVDRCAHILLIPVPPDVDPEMVLKVPHSDSRMPVLKPVPVCPQDTVTR